jgi:predicted TIM-barrel fold metal-dependent hydrolase
MKIIDFHAHCFPDDLAGRAVERVLTTSPGARCWTDGTMAGLRTSMKESGVTKAVVLPVATKPSQVRTINRQAPLLRAPDIIPFGALHPAAEDSGAEISFMKSNDIRGIKLHPEFQDFNMDDPAVFPLYEACASAGLIVVFHTGTDPGPFTNDHSLPHMLAAVHRAFPRLRIVAGHMGGHQVWDEVGKHLVGLPLYFETSTAPTNFSPENFVRLCRRHGMERVLFGTDTPWYGQRFDREWIERCGLTDSEKELVFHRNAEKLLAE